MSFDPKIEMVSGRSMLSRVFLSSQLSSTLKLLHRMTIGSCLPMPSFYPLSDSFLVGLKATFIHIANGWSIGSFGNNRIRFGIYVRLANDNSSDNPSQVVRSRYRATVGPCFGRGSISTSAKSRCSRAFCSSRDVFLRRISYDHEEKS